MIISASTRLPRVPINVADGNASVDLLPSSFVIAESLPFNAGDFSVDA